MNEKIIFKSLRAKNKYLVKFRNQNYILPLNIIPNFALSGKNVVYLWSRQCGSTNVGATTLELRSNCTMQLTPLSLIIYIFLLILFFYFYFFFIQWLIFKGFFFFFFFCNFKSQLRIAITLDTIPLISIHNLLHLIVDGKTFSYLLTI